MKSAGALIHNTKSHSHKLSEILNREVETIPNGYDPEQFDKYRGQMSGKSPFTLSFVGTLHTNTNPYVFLEGFYLFVTKTGLGPDDCNVTFTGSGFWEVENRYARFASIRPFVTLEPAVAQEEAVRRMCSADILLSFPLDMEGCIPAKTYEYVASGRPILLSPGGEHRGAIKDVLDRTRSGVVLDSPEEIAQWLEKRYEEFLKTGMVPSQTDLYAATVYSRQKQASKLAEILDGITTKARR
jgi:glycosyltransferase involved in cell wall biosynthesis